MISAKKLLICTPALCVDDHFHELIASLGRLRAKGVVFHHLIVGPARVATSLTSAASPISSEFVSEREGTRGVFDAVQQGIEYGLGVGEFDYVGYINADDLLYEKFADFWNDLTLKGADVSVARCRWIGRKSQSFGVIPWWPFKSGASRLFEIGCPPFTQQAVILKVHAWRQSRGFNLRYRYIADSDLWRRLLECGSTFHFFNIITAGYRLRPGQLSGNRDAVKDESNEWRKPYTISHVHKVLKILFRIYNWRTYLMRLASGSHVTTEKATALGGFDEK